MSHSNLNSSSDSLSEIPNAIRIDGEAPSTDNEPTTMQLIGATGGRRFLREPLDLTAEL